MHLTVLGASGRTGRQIVRQALDAGHRVTSVVRDPARLDPARHPSLEAFTADPLDPVALAPAVAGRDAVISALGPNSRADGVICTAGARAAIAAARETGTRRLVVITGAGAFIDDGDGPFTRAVFKPLLRRLYLGAQFTDFENAEREVRASALDWTLVRPPRLTDGPARPYRTAVDRNIRGGLTLSRASLATAVLALLPDPATTHHHISAAH
ncbi:NAD(P)-dependent oxidoreductase [Actinocorallia sp. A-T 12471]|uniref:NAD(P)-dependent oxidoreductase n=1 Tax=Actinocorallia sp. A-T 12471 TaxID=3089813 RepID=UPI0029CB4F21|nr:NAD(P)H-binding protein [Actinocorallia sp. A-T 12471]MDX6741907.1 NAD(P)H-binding protein [Actinocorallia sp. A-T 12471]